MNHRQKELLRILLIEDGAVHIRDIAEQLECSEKTVRNDLDKIEEYLLDYADSRLIRKPGFGIAIESTEEDRTALLGTLLSEVSKTNEERLLEIAYELLTSEKAVTLKYFADRYYVAKAAVKKDLEIITDWLQRYELELISKPRIGHVIEGSELNKRNALAHLSQLGPLRQDGKNAVLDLFLPYEIMLVRKALQRMEDEFSFAFTDDTVESLLVHALIMIKRTRQKSRVFVDEAEMAETADRREYQYTSYLFDRLTNEFGLSFPEEERVYFTWHLMSSKRMEEGIDQDFRVNPETADLVQSLIAKMGRLTSYRFEGDTMLMNSLAVHMHSVINRLNFGFPITNPLLTNIKKMYPYMFHMVMLALEEIKEPFAVEIPEDEAAYLVLHFQASVQRLEQKNETKKKVIIVCHMGIGMSHLLEAKIEQQYQEIEVLACVGKGELDKYLKKEQADFIISTVPLEKVSVKHIVVSPLFGQEDKKKVSKFVEELEHGKSDHPGTSVFSLFLSENLVFFNVRKEHRYEMVEFMAWALYKHGYVSKDYIHSAVKRERKSATSVGGGVAIPHGNPETVQRSVLAVAILEKPMEWGNEQVSLVFMLAIAKKDHGAIRGIMGEIALLSESPIAVYALSGARDYQEFKAILENGK
ncbi:activator of the mannose operon, transcriptional antiterminator [Fictibacillus enclensis]|uniref:Transcriptional antiterminator n=1 Tax=Fictibacillus enclensis TaxID=1017270 RepID=A0A0V8J238_9BACL|nr:BglG family transcription antiterminator [Fictibacillus enclensis]KSU81137.1 transcriptional antiterminator [Fictibacillus enclensis]SCC35430.1 activator of the mannose operon, transcriptional antiterminator [Fictibacillus enclensis]